MEIDNNPCGCGAQMEEQHPGCFKCPVCGAEKEIDKEAEFEKAMPEFCRQMRWGN